MDSVLLTCFHKFGIHFNMEVIDESWFDHKNIYMHILHTNLCVCAVSERDPMHSIVTGNPVIPKSNVWWSLIFSMNLSIEGEWIVHESDWFGCQLNDQMIQVTMEGKIINEWWFELIYFLIKSFIWVPEIWNIYSYGKNSETLNILTYIYTHTHIYMHHLSLNNWNILTLPDL